MSTEERTLAIRRSMDVRHIEAGTSRRLRHGIYAVSLPSVRAEVADEAAIIYARAAWLDEARDGLLVEATARLVTQLRRLDAVIEQGESGATLTSMYTRLEGQLTRNLTALGMTPAASASLGLASLDAASKVRREAEARMAKYAPKRKRGKP